MKRKKFRLGYLDYVIIAAVIFFGVGIYSRYHMSQKHAAMSDDVRADIVVELHALNTDELSSLLSDTALRTEHGDYFGELGVQTIRATPAKIRKVGLDGRLSIVESKSLYDVQALVSTHGAMTKNGFFLLGDFYLAPNMTLTVNTSCGSFRIFITNIDVT